MMYETPIKLLIYKQERLKHAADEVNRYSKMRCRSSRGNFFSGEDSSATGLWATDS